MEGGVRNKKRKRRQNFGGRKNYHRVLNLVTLRREGRTRRRQRAIAEAGKERKKEREKKVSRGREREINPRIKYQHQDHHCRRHPRHRMSMEWAVRLNIGSYAAMPCSCLKNNDNCWGFHGALAWKKRVDPKHPFCIADGWLSIASQKSVICNYAFCIYFSCEMRIM